MSDDRVIWVCYPPPGSGLPRKRTAAPSAAAARIRLGKFLRAETLAGRLPAGSGYFAPNYVIRRPDEPAPY